MRLLWLSGSATLVLFGGIAWYLAPLDPGALALQLAFTPRAFGAIIHVWSPEQLARYREHLAVDFALIAAYATFGYGLVGRTRLFAATGRRMRMAAQWCLPAAGVFDIFENLWHYWLTAAPRFGVPAAYAVAASCALAKWLLIVAFGGVLLYALARASRDDAEGED